MNEQVKELMDNPDFAQVLAESEKYYEDSPSFYNWAPPNGTTSVVIKPAKMSKIHSKKLEKEVLCVHLPVLIVDGENENKEFDLFGQYGCTGPYFSSLKTVASVLAGEPVTELLPALSTIADNVGIYLSVQTTRAKAKDGSGNVYVNHKPLEVLDADAGEVEAPAE